jgi:hypothetical protein
LAAIADSGPGCSAAMRAMRSNNWVSSGDGRLFGGLAARLGLPQQLGQPGPALAEASLLASQVGVELAEDLH